MFSKLFRVCSDSQIGLRVISGIHLEWVPNSCVREHSRHTTRHLFVWISRLYLPLTTPHSHSRHTRSRTQPHSFPIEINFVTVAQNVIWNIIFFVVVCFAVVGRSLAVSFHVLESVCGHANSSGTPNMRAHTHNFDWVEPDDNNKRCQMNARHRQQQQRRSDMHSMNYYGQLAPKWMSCQCEKIMFRFETCLAHTLHHIREQIIIYKIKI